ncbi:MAG: hypothetical protein KatS3mg057_0211 [Herpetosiphonaceae bacterium]|nr:MAG: hypothetical protein KatS3mg057_0211 [Herpetosiphonaceae bacterium]
MLFEQFCRSHNHAGGTVAALYRAMVDERLLDWMQCIGGVSCACQPFDCRKSCIMGLWRRHQTRHHCLPIEPDGTCAALALGAALLRASEPDIFAEHVEERFVVPAGDFIALSIDRGADDAVEGICAWS